VSKKTKYRCYAVRDRHLRGLGYESYSEYLLSPLWASIRARVYSLKGRTCRLCPHVAEVCHHQSYAPAVLRGDDITHILPLCRRCHHEIEYNHRGGKRGMYEVHKIVRQMKYKKSQQ